jgi:dTDP-4-dehydrorhamnose reductase
MHALVLGAGGQLGSDLLAVLPNATGFTREQLSIVDADDVRVAVRAVRPEVVFNCAAYNAVDGAEQAPDEAMAVNAEGAAAVAAACAVESVRLVHFSTNFVFDGELARPYLETDEPRPLGAYARSKLEGERRVLTALPEALVVRSAGLYGLAGSAIKGGSFPERVLKQARSGAAVRIVDDQRLNPTYTADLARAAAQLAAGQQSGVVHLVAAGCCSFYELAREFLQLAGLADRLQRITSSELRAAAPRPRNGCLASVRVEPLRPWQSALRDYWAAYQAKSPDETQPM